jgi:hypothetical protein
MIKHDRMRKAFIGVLGLGVLAPVILAVDGPAAVAAERMFTVGVAETVLVYPGAIRFKARIDTGATTTSIDARNIKRFMRGGKHWVSFDINGKHGQKVHMERPIVRRVRIKRFGQESKHRSVVMIGICLGSYYKETQVTLQDRRRREFPVLIGRRYLAGAMLVDPGRENLVEPNCPGHK